MGPDTRRDIRDSYACDCGPRTVTVGRLVRKRDDPGETNLQRAEDATGVRPIGCPWKSLSDPFVIEVVRAHRWWKASQLATKYPQGVPPEIVWGVETFDAAIDAVHAADRRLDREERERERDQARAKQQQPTATPPKPRRR